MYLVFSIQKFASEMIHDGIFTVKPLHNLFFLNTFVEPITGNGESMWLVKGTGLGRVKTINVLN